METNTFWKNIEQFSRDSMVWCHQESEKATAKVSQILEILIEDAKRISSMSQSALEAVENLRKDLKSSDGDVDTQSLIKGLKRLCNEHVEINDVAFPIIEALQFQDRIRQNMENMGKAMDVWNQHRMKAAEGADADDALLEFGKALLSNTTMIEERDMIRRHIEGLPEEEKSEDVLLF